jgi:amino acid transporter
MARSAIDWILGRPLATAEEARERLSSLEGVAVLGLDALSSTAYGPEAALTVILPLGAAGVRWLEPLTLAILVVLGALYFSYRQTIAAYPGGGGSYTVARENLGQATGRVAAAALLVDYLLNVAVGTSAGVGALASAFPPLASAFPPLADHRLAAALAVLAFIALLNLRGLREAGLAFLAPTYAFLATAAVVLAVGAIRALQSGGAPVPVVPPAPLPAVAAAATPWLLLRAFAAGCTAMTGVEAVSNGVPAFRPPSQVRARRTLAVIALSLAVLLVGVALECRWYGVGATPPEGPRYQSVLSQLAGAVAGRGVLYHLFMAATFAVLALSVNTSFADFPRVCSMLARDGVLPAVFSHRGRRLSFTAGILTLWLLASLLLVAFGGVTDRLIPLFAVGAFSAFTLSQSGMVAHWLRVRGPGWRRAAALNGGGAVVTGLSLGVIVVAKFVEGAWLSALAIPALALWLGAMGRRRARVQQALALRGPLALDGIAPPIVLVALLDLDRAAERALRFALALSRDVRAVHVAEGGADPEQLRLRFDEWVAAPARRAGLPPPRLEIVASPYRELVHPLVEVVRAAQAEDERRPVTVVVPEVLHGARPPRWVADGSALVAELLLLECSDRVSVVQVPYAVPV